MKPAFNIRARDVVAPLSLASFYAKRLILVEYPEKNRLNKRSPPLARRELKMETIG
jgi:hypothetical protein